MSFVNLVLEKFKQMTTRLSDVVQHDKEFLATVFQKLTELSVMRAAGVVVSDAAIAERAGGAGKITSIPFYNALANDEASIGSDDPSVKITPGKITQGEQIAVRNFRNKAWSSMDLTAQLLNDDPMNAIATRVAEYWAGQEERTTISILKGILADNVAANGSDMVAGDGTGLLNIDLLIDAAGTAGDAQGQFTTLIVHSAVYRALQKGIANAFVPKDKTDIGFATYAGYKVIYSDLMPVASGVYTSVLVGSNAILSGEAAPKVPVAVTRDEAAGNGSGQETLYHRRQFVLHPNGMQFNAPATSTGSIVGASPTNAEFEAATSWGRAYDRKNVPVAFIKSNLS